MTEQAKPQPDLQGLKSRPDIEESVELELRQRLTIVEHELGTALRLVGFCGFATAAALVLFLLLSRKVHRS